MLLEMSYLLIMSDFNTFITNTETQLKAHLKNREIKEFSEKLLTVYPTSMKFFPNETEILLKQHGIQKLIATLKKHSILLMTEYKSYEVQADKVILEKKDTTKEEYPVINVGDFLKDGLSLKENIPGFFLISSFMIIPMNYDYIQLCRVYLSKT
jgi:hypothetical protein